MVTEVTSSTFLSDTVLFLRDKLDSNITDPLSASRGNTRFVMTSYPQKETLYPVITVTDAGISQEGKLGMASEGTLMRIGIEIRIWARNIKERDTLFNEVYDWLRTNQRGGSDSTIDANLHDFSLGSTVNVSEENVKSKVIEINYLFLCGD